MGRGDWRLARGQKRWSESNSGRQRREIGLKGRGIKRIAMERRKRNAREG